MKDNLIKFPKSPVRAIAANDSAADSKSVCGREEGRGEAIAPRIALGVLKGLGFAIYMVMMWLRGVVAWGASLLSVLFLIGAAFAWIALDDTRMSCSFLVSSFVLFALVWCYDRILMALSPIEVMATL